MRYGSLFTGAGGLDLAVHMLWPDAQLAWWSEVDEPAAKSFARHTDAPNLGDITAIDWSQVDPVDMIVGGFPCQDLSHAGKRAGLSGDRSGLWFRMAEAIDTLRPSLVLAENVQGIYSAGGNSEDVDVDRDPLDARRGDATGALGTVLGTLADLGFDAEWGMLAASDVGACHRRRRWFCVAWKPEGVGVEGWRGAGDGDTREVAGTGVSGRPGAGDLGMTLLPTPRSTDGPKGGPGQVNGRGVPDSLPAIGALLPTPDASANRKSTRAMTSSGAGDGNGRRAGGGQSSPPGLAQLAEIAAGRWPDDMPPYDDLPPSTRATVDALLPTPRVSADRASRSSLTADGHWSAPSLGQAVELVQGILPREYESWDEVQGWHRRLMPTPTAQAAKHGATEDVNANGYGSNLWDIPHQLGRAQDRWGAYGPAIARWEHVVGRSAPDPTDDKGRLSAAFVEWMLGWPDGWTEGSRSQRLKMCGNGVVPLQAAHAYMQLLERATQAQEAAA